ncbi:MAG TPA: hydroxymethylbilane synthase [Gammaproteobacteria bacterium]|nr:hydroxymethylbilane synthase [Xanthomonadales bacterium]HOP22796.1 hydroxymethylbilane synthase [Gammaproteobacteria bacterium]HPI95250.1 hydroxymethylbilane synthase [Gammaproteobacteria bacterium]HPQ87327.1 hydroxymethylbilane synthase [Gammaproteobacteria bacterium]
MTNKKIIIATRNSPLALWQAEYAASLIEKTFPSVKTELLPMTTKGDRILDVTLNKIGGKGLFLKELEQAMKEGEADIAVHSMKDVPADMPEGFEICCVFKRHDASDAFVSNHYSSLDDLPQNSVVGTSSLRRQSQLLAIRPDLKVKPLRGNVQTRLRKLDEGEYDAIILATAGLERMNLDNRIKSKLKPNDWLPAVGQGAVGVECLSDRQDLKDLLSQLNHAETSECVNAERTLNQILNGSCSVAIGAYAQRKDDKLTMEAIVCAPDGTQTIRQKAESDNSQDLGRNVGRQLLADGAQAILDLGND